MALWLLTRPEDDSERTLAALEAAGHQAVSAPVIAIDAADPEAVDLEGVQALLFTSANGVRAFARLSPRRELPVLAVGPASAEEARRLGFSDVAAAAGDVVSLAGLARRTRDPAAGTLFHAAGRDTAGDLAGELSASGFDVRRRVLYRARPERQLSEAARRTLDDPALAGILFFSPRTAETFVRLVREAGLTDRLARLAAACLSPNVAGRLDRADWADIRIAERPDLPALVAALAAPPSPGIRESERMTSRDDKTDAGDTPAGKPAEAAGPGAAPGRPAGDAEPPHPATADPGPGPESATGPGDAAGTEGDDPPGDGPGTAAGQVVEAFGGIRPMATKLGAPVTTVQGWKKRGHIPPARQEEIRAAAERHGIDLDPEVLAAAVTETEGEPVSAVEAQPSDTERTPAEGKAVPATEATPDAAGVTAGEAREGVQPWGATAVAAEPEARPADRAAESDVGEGEDDGPSQRAAVAPAYQPPPKTGRGIAWLALLVAVLAGGAALWLAYARPPAGLPVPPDRMTALQNRIDALEGALQSQAAPAAGDDLAGRIAALEQQAAGVPPDVPDRLARLEAQVDAVESAALTAEPPDLADLQERVGELERLVREGGAGAGAAAGQAAEDVATLRGELADLSQSLSNRLDDLTTAVEETRGAGEERLADLAGRVDATAARVDDLAARLEPVAARVGELADRLDDVAATVERLSASDTATQALVLAIGQLRDALETGPFADALGRVRALVGEDEALADALAEIGGFAEEGIPTRAVLTARYPAVAREIRQAAASEREGDWVDRSLAAVQGLVTVRRQDGEVQGSDAPAITARAEARLESGNLQGAVEALGELDGAAAEAAAPWLADAAARLAAEAALDRLTLAAVDRLAGASAAGAPPGAPAGAPDAEPAGAPDAEPEEAAPAAPADGATGGNG